MVCAATVVGGFLLVCRFRPGARRDLTIAVRGVERTFPAYVIEGEVIWGMTERILTPFLQLIGAVL